MSEPVTQAAKAAVSGIREALAVGKELEAVTKDIQDLQAAHGGQVRQEEFR